MIKNAIAALRVVATRKGARDMDAGLVWVEAYLPFDVQAFADFSELVAKSGSAVAAQKIDPELCKRALDPLDAHGEAMLPEDLQQLAHSFLIESRKMDVGHDQRARSTVHLVESFLNTAEIASPKFWPGAWVAVFKVDPGSAEWAKIERGELNAVSFQADVFKIPVTIAERP